MRALWGVLALCVVLVCGMGCRGGDTDKPRLDAWTVPVAEVPKLLSALVPTIVVDKTGAVWFGTDGRGVSRYDPKTGAWATFTQKDGLASDNVRMIAADGGGVLWFGTEGHGVSRYDPKTGAWATFTTKDGLADDNVQAIAADGGGALWFGAESGVSRYDPKTGAWTTFTQNDGLAYDSVIAIAADEGGALWFGTYGHGVSRYDPKTGAWATFTQKDGLVRDIVQAIAVDGGGALWFGTNGAGVSRYDPKSGAWTTFTDANGLASNRVQAITADGGGALWFGTDSGVSRYDPKTGGWATFTTKDGLASNIVLATAADGGGALWFGTDSGVSRYDFNTGVWAPFTQKDGLASDQVYAIAADGGGALWFGTNGGGVSRYDPKTGAWATFTTKDGLASNVVRAIAADGGGALWFGAGVSGVSRYDPKTGAWVNFTEKDGPASNLVLAIAVDGGGALWLVIAGGSVRCYDPKTGAWSTPSLSFPRIQKEGLTLLSDNVLAITADAGGVLWFGTAGRGVGRYDPKTGAWANFTQKDGLASDNVQAIAVDGGGALWLATNRGVTRMDLSSPTEAGALSTVRTLPAHARFVMDHGKIVLTRPAGLSYGGGGTGPVALPSHPAGAPAEILVPGPEGSVWVGTTLGGLVLRKPGRDLQLTSEGGLPSMTVTALVRKVVSNGKSLQKDPSSVWVGTSAGTALVHTDGQALRVERVVSWESMPTGPVDALSAADGAVFIAYNQLPRNRFLDPKHADRRARTRVFRVSNGDTASEIAAPDKFAKSDVRELTFSEKHGLWAATSAGLFGVDRKGGAASLDPAGFHSEAGNGRLTPVPLGNVTIAPDSSQTLWMWTEKQGSTPPFIIGYRPGTDWVYNITQDLGVPEGDAIDDFAFSDDGDLVVLAGSRLVKGRVFVPATPTALSPWNVAVITLLGLFGLGVGVTTVRWTSLAGRVRRRPALLREIPLASVSQAIEALRRAGTLDEVWGQLDLPPRTRHLVGPLASFKVPGALELRALAELLGMAATSSAEVTPHPHGLNLLAAHLAYPAPLRNRTLALVALDPAPARLAGSVAVRTALEAALRAAGHRFDLPFVLLGAGDLGREVIPPDFIALLLETPELYTLLFARNPEQTFAGLLHTRGLLVSSPYDTAGAVKEAPMFFGRFGLLREILVASSLQQILVGPRRVGKTSLLRTLQRELPTERTDVEVFFLDLLGIKDSSRAARSFANQIGATLPAGADPDTALTDLLETRYRGSGKKGILLIDEADGLISTDSAKGFPLFNAMRSLQAEGTCSFVLAGYLYLYREALDQGSPLYNFANLRLLGPLEPEAARDLALVPMKRLGVTYADPALPARIAERTGGYPSFVQLLCDAILRELSGGDLTITLAHVVEAEKSPRVRGELGDMFRMNAGRTTQIAVYGLLHCADFTRADAEQSLSRALGRAPLAMVEQALLELRIFGFAVEKDGRFAWAIPLLRDTLLASEPELSQKRLVEDLAEAGEAEGT
jgi:ligand-binding sensor domain-containing protein